MTAKRGGWFKVRDAITDDPQVRQLDADSFRLYVSILCVLRKLEYVSGDICVSIETIIYHSCAKKRSVLQKLASISQLKLGDIEYMPETKEVRLNFPNWLEHQWDWIRKLKDFEGKTPDEVRKLYVGNPQRQTDREDKQTERPRRRPVKVQRESSARTDFDNDFTGDGNKALLNKIANPLKMPVDDEENSERSPEAVVP